MAIPLCPPSWANQNPSEEMKNVPMTLTKKNMRESIRDKMFSFHVDHFYFINIFWGKIKNKQKKCPPFVKSSIWGQIGHQKQLIKNFFFENSKLR